MVGVGVLRRAAGWMEMGVCFRLRACSAWVWVRVEEEVVEEVLEEVEEEVVEEVVEEEEVEVLVTVRVPVLRRLSCVC